MARVEVWCSQCGENFPRTQSQFNQLGFSHCEDHQPEGDTTCPHCKGSGDGTMTNGKCGYCFGRGFEGPCPDCCNGTIVTKDTGDMETSEFATCPTCKGDSRQ